MDVAGPLEAGPLDASADGKSALQHVASRRIRRRQARGVAICPSRRGSEHKEDKAAAAAPIALRMSSAAVHKSLQNLQLNDWWTDQEQKHLMPIMLLKLTAGPSRYLSQDNNTAASRRSRLRFDRSGLNESRYRRRLTLSPDCPDCKLCPDTAEHVLLECPTYDQARQRCQTSLQQFGLHLSYPLAMGAVEQLSSLQLQADVLSATAKLLEAIGRISSRRS